MPQPSAECGHLPVMQNTASTSRFNMSVSAASGFGKRECHKDPVSKIGSSSRSKVLGVPRAEGRDPVMLSPTDPVTYLSCRTQLVLPD